MKQMNKFWKFTLLFAVLFVAVLFTASCSKDPSPFGDMNKDGCTVSVKYDANGGVFTTNTSVIFDTYNPTKYTPNASGDIDLKLFTPDNELRGEQRYFVENVKKTEDGDITYYLAGWYAERNEIKDAEGNVTGYTYGGRWDFENGRLSVKADGEYDAKEPVLTLYAAWLPAITYEFYMFGENGSAELVSSIDVNPLSDTTLTLPAFDAVTGKVGAENDFPKLVGKTYDKIYSDENKTNEITGETMLHSGTFNAENATFINPVMKIYCTATEGVTYKVSTPDQLTKAADASAQYIIEEDLDFTGKYWPALFLSGEFTGKVIGGGHTIKNITVTQNSISNTVFGLFGIISSKATLENITFDSIKVNVMNFSRSQTAYGILAGEIEDGARISGITLTNSKMEITNSNALLVAVNNINPLFGLVAARGEITGITFSTENVTALVGTGTANYDFTPDAKGQFTLTRRESQIVA